MQLLKVSIDRLIRLFLTNTWAICVFLFACLTLFVHTFSRASYLRLSFAYSFLSIILSFWSGVCPSIQSYIFWQVAGEIRLQLCLKSSTCSSPLCSLTSFSLPYTFPLTFSERDDIGPWISEHSTSSPLLPLGVEGDVASVPLVCDKEYPVWCIILTYFFWITFSFESRWRSESTLSWTEMAVERLGKKQTRAFRRN